LSFSRSLADGGLGVVRIARHSKTGQYAAVKIASKMQLQTRRSLNNAEADEERAMLFLEREIVVMKLVDHPNIMHLYDVWETSGELYLILEYVEGGELFDYIADRKRLPASEALDLFQQLIGAMEYLQYLKIAHRDLKPENLLLDNKKVLKIADFGMAAWLGNEDLQKTACGSPHYASPEIIANKPYDGTISDIWSCGVILYALLTGRLPFDDEDTFALLQKVTTGKYVMPSDIDVRAQDLLKKMLEKDVSKRIKILDIKKHPWFVSQPRRIPEHPVPSLDVISRPLKDPSSIDSDILANLRTLWHNAPEEEIVSSLLSNEQTWEKTVYALLLRYRVRCQENYLGELGRAKTQRREERKRLKAEQKPKRPSTLPSAAARTDPLTPGRARNRDVSPNSRPPSQLVEDHNTLGQNYLSPNPYDSPSDFSSSIAPTSPGSPLWQVLDVAPPIEVPELQEERVQKYFQQIMDHLNMMQNLPETFTPATSASTPMKPVHPPHASGLSRIDEVYTPPSVVLVPRSRQNTATDTRELGITADSLERGKENTAPILIQKKSSLRKANESTMRSTGTERRVQILLPPIAEGDSRRVSSSSGGSSCGSPDIALSEASSFSVSSAPRKSWFANIFKFKPASLTIPSMLDESASRTAARRLLTNAGVNVVVTHSEEMRRTFLHCTLDEVRDPAGVMAVAKAVRFRVEFHVMDTRSAPTGALYYKIDMEMILEKGAMSSFKLVHQRLKKEWEFVEDVQPSPYTSRIRSPAGYDLVTA
jgi:serine/threonine-protein kinase HSL1, negative regulator of Swe1 kinase